MVMNRDVVTSLYHSHLACFLRWLIYYAEDQPKIWIRLPTQDGKDNTLDQLITGLLNRCVHCIYMSVSSTVLTSFLDFHTLHRIISAVYESSNPNTLSTDGALLLP